MPVFKLSHFFNPSLFPIYDTDVIWNKVMDKVFRTEWKMFYDQTSPLTRLGWHDRRWIA